MTLIFSLISSQPGEECTIALQRCLGIRKGWHFLIAWTEIMDGLCNKRASCHLGDCWLHSVSPTNEWPGKTEDQASEKVIVTTFHLGIGEAWGWKSTERTLTLVFWGLWVFLFPLLALFPYLSQWSPCFSSQNVFWGTRRLHSRKLTSAFLVFLCPSN